MKIAVINSASLPMPPVKGGAVQTLIEMYLGYNEIECLHEFTVYSIGAKEATEAAMKYKRTKFIYINTEAKIFKLSRVFRSFISKTFYSRIANAYISKVDRLLRRDQYDICIIENVPSFILNITKNKNIKYVLHQHNDSLNVNTFNAKIIADSYDEVFAVSNYIADRVREINGKCKVTTLHNGIDLDRFNLSNLLDKRNDIRARYGYSNDDVVLLYTGRLKEHKGIKMLIEAFVKINGRDNLKLLVAGSVFFKQKGTNLFTTELVKLSKIAGDRVIFTGYIDYEKLPELYAAADIGVVPSICEEGFPLVVVEHMAMGNALIATDTRVIPEIVNDSCSIIVNRNESLVDSLIEAIIMLHDDIEVRNNMMEAALERVKVYSAENYNYNFFRLINEAVQ